MDLTADELDVLAELFLLILSDRYAEGVPPVRVDELRDGLNGDVRQIGQLSAVLDYLQSAGEVEVRTKTAEVVLQPAGVDHLTRMYRHSILVVGHEGLHTDVAEKAEQLRLRAYEGVA